MINIVPGVSIYSVLSRLNYKPWFALAEFVDNAVQSMLTNLEVLKAVHGDDYKLIVSIDTSNDDGGRITIRDNAAGIRIADFPRAFRAAQLPPDTQGLSEFGMGMKSASCWFAREWSVRTTTIGDARAHIIKFDVAEIVSEQLEELNVYSVDEQEELHFTEVRLTNLHRPLASRTLGKIRQHLTDIYRVLIRRGDLELRLNNQVLHYEMPAILEAPYYRNPAGETVSWKKDISFTLGAELSVVGFAALRETGSNSNAGFSLFRRGRVIEGSGDDGYRPPQIFGAGNSFKSQRLFGELHLDGFAVSHTKDGFQWDDHEQDFLEILLESLDAEPLPLLRQAQGFRKLEHSRSVDRYAELAVESTLATLQENLAQAVVELSEIDKLTHEIDASKGVDVEVSASSDQTEELRRVSFTHNDCEWNVSVEVVSDPSDQSWFSKDVIVDRPSRLAIHIRLNSAHRFLIRFGQRDSESLEVILRMAVALVVAEVLARQAGLEMAGIVRTKFNDVLTRALSNP